MFVFGFDPGYDRLGVAVVENEKLVFSTCIQTDRNQDFSERLKAIACNLENIFDKFPPQKVGIEKLFLNYNQKTAMAVAEVVGVIRVISAQKGAKIQDFTPTQIKTAVSGNGRASKEDVIRMVTLITKLPPQKRLDDEYDAIAVALTASILIR